ncbi:MAG: hypothetical protein M1840_008594 [Geoglossum simile]|nr:MAG: hypothetical protein M1840_008594 [Geoglossum simile]
MEARDQAETEFFSKGAWSELRRDNVGISALRSRLSKVLFNQIKTELPSLITDVQREIGKAQAKLSTLGESRSTPAEQRAFLLDLSLSFSLLCKASCDGSFDDPFFGDSLTDIGYTRRLRAIVQNANSKFADTMRKRGHQRDIKDTADTEDEEAKRLRGELPEKISRKEALDRVRHRPTRSRGRELPGTFNPMLIGELFHEQARPWAGLSHEHLDQVWEATKVFLENTINHLTDRHTYNALFQQWMDRILDEKLQHAHETVDRLMQDCGKHPITYNHYFIENVQKTIQKHREVELTKNLRKFFGQGYGEDGDQIEKTMFSLKSLVASLSAKTEADTDTYACIELLDRMQAYYKVALKTFIDNIAIQAMEGLIGSLWEIFSPSAVATMSNELIENIAAETSDSQEERLQPRRKLETLQSGMEILKRHVARGGRANVQKRGPTTPDTKMFPYSHEEENERASTGGSTPATPECRGLSTIAYDAPAASPAFSETRGSRYSTELSREETYPDNDTAEYHTHSLQPQPAPAASESDWTTGRERRQVGSWH